MNETPNRIGDGLTVSTPETNKRLAPISPTGKPWIPTSIVPYVAAVVGLAGVVLTLTVPPVSLALPPVVVAICTAIVGIGALFGIVSPGARKAEHPERDITPRPPDAGG